ncbi:MAG: lysylphosphatidylglycerol synthase transmembrane domain-containing protein [Planctomycetota bacterium]
MPDTPELNPPADTKARVIGWLRFALRWGIAIAGIAWVVTHLTIRDQTLVLDADNIPRDAAIIEPFDGSRFDVEYHDDGTTETVPRDRLVRGPDRGEVTVAGAPTALLGMRLREVDRQPVVEALLVRDGEVGRWIDPELATVNGRPYRLSMEQPLIQIGLRHLVADADPLLLALGMLAFPSTFLLTTVRWQKLLQGVGITLTFGRTLTLNMVGLFYSSFLLGSTGGDVIKAVYAARQTSAKGRAVISVLFDRGVGLVALIILGGSGAVYGWVTAGSDTPTGRACMQVAIISFVVLAFLLVGAFVLFHPASRDRFGIVDLLPKLPGAARTKGLIEALEDYARRPGLVAYAIALTFPVHIAVVLCGYLGGRAFGLEVTPMFYLVAVPVIILVGSIPITPQGAGVQEFFAVLLLQRQGVTVGEAFALTMFIRLAHILWYLTGGLFVLKGGYGEGKTSDDAEPDTPAAEPIPSAS